MKKIQSLVILSKEYPSKGDPVYTFVDELACGLCDLGVRVTVVAPLDRSKILLGRKKSVPYRTIRKTPGGREIEVLRPRYFSLTNRRGLVLRTYRNFYRAARRTVSRLSEKPDAIYGHFISMAGLAAADIGEKLGIPAFMAYGESSLSLCAHFDRDFIRERLERLRGIVAVSSKNRDELLGAGLFSDAARVRVFPNAVDGGKFRARDRQAARRALGFAQDAFIVSFCGYFIERKGVLRLCRAMDTAGGMAGIFIGRGEQKPDCENILFCGSLPHDEVPNYLAASDVFALPTLAEGCCNAIVEALGCALPVVSSDRPFNDDILNDGNSLRVDPMDIRQLSDALVRLRDDAALRDRLSKGAAETAERLTLPGRAAGIRSFMEEML